MNRKEHILSLLGEEANEVAQRVSKALRFGLDERQPGQGLTNAQRIMDEMHDMFVILELLDDEGIMDVTTPTREVMEVKKEKVMKFIDYAYSLKTIIKG